MSDELDVLAANEAFYAAFQQRDVDAMRQLWSLDEPNVACVHPGWDALVGRSAVLASFRAILEGAAAPRIHCSDATAHVFGGAAYVICRESVDGTELVATNVFVREGGDWKMVHHHAGPVSARRPEARPSPPKRGDLN